MKRIIYDYENPHIVGREKKTFSVIKLIVIILAISLAVTLIYIIFFKDASYSCESKSYYMLVVGTYDNDSVARDAAEQIRQRGGGGYILNDEGYSVIASVYLNRSDALAVANRYGWQVRNTPKVKLKFEMSQKTLSQKAAFFCAYPEKVIEELYNIAISMDKNEISVDSAAKAIETLKGELQRYINDLKKYENSFSGKYQSIFNVYDTICKTLQDINDLSSSKLKYGLIEITCVYESFVNNFADL